ncbi:MAG: hypothetical protein COA45_12300 [Zetaproteobacteria bacterium]|nr:MAG: hypothetical protein COA45_12300 [Zetaproteobacteria bacterium]
MTIKKQHNKTCAGKTYAKKPTVYSIMDAVSYLITECQRLNDIENICILQKALAEMQEGEPLSELDRQELDKMIDLFRSVLNLSKSERLSLVDLLERHECENIINLSEVKSLRSTRANSK